MSYENMLNGKTFSILGDSYSTFQGYIPEDYACYYPRLESVDDVFRVEDTWWHKLGQENGMKLLVNNSYSGSTVCTQVRETQPKAAAFALRANECSFSGTQGETPDYIMVFGGTNDSWLGRTPGELQNQDWSAADLEQVLPAYCYVLDRLSLRYPDSRIMAVINTDLDPVIKHGLLRAAEYYKAAVVELARIDKQNGHPSALGMSQIAQQIQSVLCAELP